MNAPYNLIAYSINSINKTINDTAHLIIYLNNLYNRIGDSIFFINMLFSITTHLSFYINNTICSKRHKFIFKIPTLFSMEKKELLQKIDETLTEFPETAVQFEAVIAFHQRKIFQQKMANTDAKIIVFLLKKEVVPTATIPAKEKMALTLKKLCETPEGTTCKLPHLQGLHTMTISKHFRTLCKHGLTKKLQKGRYQLAQKGWEFLERANNLQDSYNDLYSLL